MSDAPRPNVLLINFDDLGYGDVSALNPESKVQTPHMDSLAADGMTFTDAHATSAVCTPSRYSLMTGRYNWRTRLESGVLWGYSPPLLGEDEPTIASTLKAEGYRTACFGKWHLGLGWAYEAGFEMGDRIERETPPIDFGVPLTSGPHTLGFDRSFILPASLDMPPYLYVADGEVVDPPTDSVATSPRPAYFRGGAAAPGFDHGECQNVFTTEAEAFLDDHGTNHADEPFFLYFPSPAPHYPHLPREPFRGTSDLGVYGDLIAECDDTVGRLLAALDRQGLAENTLVILTSDNGAHCRGDGMDYERDFGHRSNHHFRGQKSDAWDGGHRVPFLVRWPGRVAAGSTCEALVSQVDLFTTAAGLAGSPATAEDSTSLLPLLAGEPAGYEREDTVHHSVTGAFAVRDRRWKLIEAPGSAGWSLPDDEVPADQPRAQLYDMRDDPEEQNNLIVERPEVVERLRHRLATICG